MWIKDEVVVKDWCEGKVKGETLKDDFRRGARVLLVSVTREVTTMHN